MISIFQKEANGVESHSSSHKATFCFYSEHINEVARKYNQLKQGFSDNGFQKENGYFRLLH